MEPNELPDYLISIRNINTYKVPPQYFDTLAEDILQQVYAPVASALPFSAPPAGYFDNFADHILQKIKSTPNREVQQELEELEPFLAGISRTNPYTIPQGYFEAFRVPLETTKEKTPVIKMSRPKWITYAAAAVVMGAIATGAILFVEKDDTTLPSANYTAALAKVSDSDLSDYLDNSSQDIDVTPALNTGTTSSDGLYQQLLNNVSDNDIQQYLNENNDSNEKNSEGI